MRGSLPLGLAPILLAAVLSAPGQTPTFSTGVEAVRVDALVTFSDTADLRSDLTADVAAVKRALSKTGTGGGTALADAAYAGLVVAESAPGRALLVVFTDGVDTSSWLDPDGVMEAAKRSEVVVYGVSAGMPRKADFLRRLSQLTGGTLHQVERTEDLAGVFLGVLAEFRERYLLTYTPRGVTREGWHRIEVRVKTRRATVRARAGYETVRGR